MKMQKNPRYSSHFKERSQSFAYWLQYKNIREEEKEEESNLETEANQEDDNNNNNYQMPGHSTELQLVQDDDDDKRSVINSMKERELEFNKLVTMRQANQTKTVHNRKFKKSLLSKD